MEEFKTNEIQTPEAPAPVQQAPEENNNSQASALRQILGSNLALALPIVLGLSIVFSLLAAITGVNLSQTVMEYITSTPGVADGIYELGLTPGDIYTIFRRVSVVVFPLTFLFSIPGILNVVGYALLWNNSKKNETAAPTTALKLLQAVCILGIVGYAASAFILVIALVGMAIAMIFAVGAMGLVILFVYVIIMIIPGAMIGLSIAMEAGLIKSIKKIGSILSGTAFNGKISMFSIVMLYIIGFSGASSFLFSLPLLNPLYMLTTGLSAAHTIILAVVLNKIKNQLQA